MAQVIGGGPSLISDLINLIKTAALVAYHHHHHLPPITEGDLQNGLIHPDECHTTCK